MSKTNLVYIASNGRSGSTLLELLLNSLPEFWTVGELNTLPFELEQSKQLCGCGSEVKNCEFWRKITEETGDIDKKTVSPFREKHNAGKVIRLRRIYDIITNKKPDEDGFKKFCEANSKLLKNIKATAQKRKKSLEWIVDSSKSPYRLYWFFNCPGVNVRAIHVVKDPRAFVYSMTKGLSGLKFFTVTIRMIMRYIVENWTISMVMKNEPRDKVFLLRYEDLASSPAETIRGLCDWLGTPCKKFDARSFRGVENHGISGNKMRFESGGIALDEKWKNELNLPTKILISVAAYLSAKKYGYFK